MLFSDSLYRIRDHESSADHGKQIGNNCKITQGWIIRLVIYFQPDQNRCKSTAKYQNTCCQSDDAAPFLQCYQMLCMYCIIRVLHRQRYLFISLFTKQRNQSLKKLST